VPDHLTPEKRSWNMSRIRGKDTKPELIVRSMLHRAGYRFTVNGPLNNSLPGRPDIVLPKYRTVIFVHGCFWHQHPGCPAARIPKSSSGGVDWKSKLEKNVKRDRRNARRLRNEGWRVLTVWECALRKKPEQVGRRLVREL
jgi:DNA mismatch endonuclease (patch repair protein)